MSGDEKYQIVIMKSAQKDKEKIKNAPALKCNIDKLLKILRRNPYQMPPKFEKLRGRLSKFYSRRINIQHRLVYDVDDEKK